MLDMRLASFAHCRYPKAAVTKQNLLVVDADPRSLRVLEVSLRNAGYNVAACPSVGKAFEILSTNKPDLILSDTDFEDMNGFEFVEKLRQNDDWSDIPFMFLSSDGSIESKIRGLELGVEDYLTKPIYIREVVARVGIELARQARAGLARKSQGSRTRFSGSLSEMSVVDLLQTIDVSRKSGILTLVSSDGQRGRISFESGAVIDASVDELRGEDAIYRQLLWHDGTFDLEFRRVSLTHRTVHRATQALLMEGMRRLDEWSRLLELLPSLDAALEVDAEILRERLSELPDEQNEMLRLIDGERTIGEVLRAHGGDHLDALRKVVDLYFEGMVQEAGQSRGSIPIVSEVSVQSSAPVRRAGARTIPGPAGAPLERIPPLAAPPSPRLEGSATAVTATDMDLVVPMADELEPEPESVPPDRRSTPVSLPSPRIHADAHDEEILRPSDPPVSRQDRDPGFVEDEPGWKPAPPPAKMAELRHKTPKGFQAVRPETPGRAGHTILSWAGRAADIDRIDDISSRETAELGRWDRTLDELRADPEVEEAIEAIDSDPPPAPFVRSEPPGAPPHEEVTEGVSVEEEPSPDAVSDYHEPPEVDPPPLTYAQVFEEEARPEDAPKRPDTSRGTPKNDAAPPPTKLRWVLLALTVACGIGAVAYWLSMPPSEPDTAVEAASGPQTARAVAIQPRPSVEPTPSSTEPGQAVESSEPTEPTEALGEQPAEPRSAAEPAVPSIYAPTGAPDTFEAQLELARRLKRGSRATAAYRRAIELNPESSDALSELARLMLERQHAREAAELAGRATKLDPTNALGWVTLGAARQLRGDRQGATEAYQRCVARGRGKYVSECRAMLR